MASFFPNGTQYAVSTAFGAAIPVTAITNANPAECAAAAPPVDGSVVVVTSAWAALTDTVARTDLADADSFALEGVDTTSTTQFPAGEGAGSVKPVTTWATLTQIDTAEIAGGDPQFHQFQYLEDRTSRQRQKPTSRSPRTVTIVMDHDPSLPWFTALEAADATGTPVVMRAILPSGVTVYYYGYPAFNKVPTNPKNANMQNQFVLSLLADPIRYA